MVFPGKPGQVIAVVAHDALRAQTHRFLGLIADFIGIQGIFHDIPVGPFRHDLGNPVHPRRDDGKARRHRLHAGVAEGFVDRREQKEVGGQIVLLHISDGAKKVDGRSDAEPGGFLFIGGCSVGTDDDEVPGPADFRRRGDSGR